MTEAPATRPPVARTRLFIATLVAMVVFAGAVTTPAICLSKMGEEFGLSLGDRGFLGGLRVTVLLLAVLLTGYLAERRGKGIFLTAGLFLMAAGLAGTTMVGSFGTLLIAQAVMGLGAGAMEAQVNPLVAELHPQNPARPLNIVNGLFSVGLVVSALAAGEILEHGGEWRVTFWVWVIPAIIGAGLFATRRYPRAVTAAEEAANGTSFLRRPLFWLLMVAMVFGGGVEAGMTYWGANFTELEFGATPRQGAWTVAFYGAFMAIGRFTSGGLVTRISPVTLMLGSAVGCIVATAGISFAESLQGAWVLFALGGLFVACFWPTLLAVAASDVGSSTTMFACLAAAGITGCIIFPWAMGIIGDLCPAAGLRAGAAIMPVSMVLMVGVLLIVWRMGVGRPGSRTEIRR